MAKNDEKDVLLDHDYDGIQELDNDLPPWWLWLFYVTIIWSVIYLLHYHVLGTGDSSAEEYMKEINPQWTESQTQAGFSLSYHSPLSGESLTPYTRRELELARQAEKARQLAEQRAAGGFQGNLETMSFDDIIIAAMSVASDADLDKLKTAFPDIWNQYQAASGQEAPDAAIEMEPEVVEIIEPLTDEASLASGESIFISNCASCHGNLGEGGIGPNLTDDYFIHGATMNDVVNVVTNGITAKGMIAWKTVLNPQQIREVSSYVMSIRGTDPPNAKAPQGEKIELAAQ